MYCVICGKYRLVFAVSTNLKNLKYHTSLKKTLVLSIICIKRKNEDKKVFKEEESIGISKILTLIESI